ncbi:hypothetical protein D3C72_1770870 [compost metagenome]
MTATSRSGCWVHSGVPSGVRIARLAGENFQAPSASAVRQPMRASVFGMTLKTCAAVTRTTLGVPSGRGAEIRKPVPTLRELSFSG